MNKKILFIYYQNIKANGISKVLANLTSELADSGYDVEILFLMAPHKDFYHINPKVKKHYIDSFAHPSSKGGKYILEKFKFVPKVYNIYSYFYDLGSYKVLKKWIQENHQNYETIVSCWYKLSSMLSLDKEVSKKTIAWEHMSYKSGGLFWNKGLRRYYKNLRTIVSTNIPGEKHYKELNKNSLTIYNLMDNEIDNQKYIEPDQKKNIISVVARLDPEKNISEFIDIISQVNLPKDWKVVIIGSGREEKRIQQEVIDKNLTSKIELLGSRSMEEVYQLLISSKINCLTSTVEALPTILIQAMFFSNALVAYDCNYGPSDIINEGNGFLIPVHDKNKFIQELQTLTNNKGALDALMKSSYEESRKWKKEKIAQEWKKILQKN
ncbi:glycosyltransferase family 4 protein [Chryseobacterium sp. RP-3-3]|uniref:Glycosyltransferase family 4 protein n=1 Tax=Chryseobacterium antibioticum TaxID=2728847 RepID=A0A7Y0AL47_9FLAO|nr:glycosyltransferase [Chryseobacterium antibioticum]NML69353.1 glycosyltransferase family 4 protein [Chryseobacterium antibioticum]